MKQQRNKNGWIVHQYSNERNDGVENNNFFASFFSFF